MIVNGRLLWIPMFIYSLDKVSTCLTDVASLINRACIFIDNTWLQEFRTNGFEGKLQNDVSNLRRLFEMNGYPIPFFNDILSSFLRKVHEPRIQSCNESDVYTLCLPYFGNVSETFVLRFRRFCRRYNLKIRIVYKPFKVGHYFSLKSVCPKFLESCVVYKYTCPVDQASYVGKTRRHLIQRINEHRNSEQSAIYNHNVLCHCLTPKNFEILKQCRGDFELSLTEALLIKKGTANS